MQVFAAILFYAVFAELLIVLSIYLYSTLSTYVRIERGKVKEHHDGKEEEGERQSGGEEEEHTR